jgi:hypothetical protein
MNRTTLPIVSPTPNAESPRAAAGRSTRRAGVGRAAALAAGVAAALVLAFAASGAAVAAAGDTSAARQLERFAAQSGAAAQPSRGRAFFTSTHGREWSCASCHGESPASAGRHAATGKAIDPLAPAVNAAAFTDSAKVDKWFRRNCRDVTGRECTAAEKADVMAWLLSLGR